MLAPMNRDNRSLVIDEEVGFYEINEPAKVQDLQKLTNHFRGIYRLTLNFPRGHFLAHERLLKASPSKNKRC